MDNIKLKIWLLIIEILSIQAIVIVFCTLFLCKLSHIILLYIYKYDSLITTNIDLFKSVEERKNVITSNSMQGCLINGLFDLNVCAKPF